MPSLSSNPFLPYPERIRHQNPDLPISYMEDLQGGRRVVTDLTDLYSLSGQPVKLQQNVTVAFVISDGADYKLVDINNAGNSTGWLKLASALSYSGITLDYVLHNGNTSSIGATIGDLQVQNLFVAGTATTINSQSLTVKDNVIIVNNGETGAGVTNRYAGLEVDRGTLPKFELLFDETIDRWTAGATGSTLHILAYQDEIDANFLKLSGPNQVVNQSPTFNSSPGPLFNYGATFKGTVAFGGANAYIDSDSKFQYSAYPALSSGRVDTFFNTANGGSVEFYRVGIPGSTDGSIYIEGSDIRDGNGNYFIKSTGLTTGYVPYIGATKDVDLGSVNFKTMGTVDLGQGVGSSHPINLHGSIVADFGGTFGGPINIQNNGGISVNPAGVTLFGASNSGIVENVSQTTTTISYGMYVPIFTAAGLSLARANAATINTFLGLTPGSYVPTSRNLTINGVTYDLSADRSWSETDPTVPAYAKTLSAFSVIKTSGDAVWHPLENQRLGTANSPNFAGATINGFLLSNTNLGGQPLGSYVATNSFGKTIFGNNRSGAGGEANIISFAGTDPFAYGGFGVHLVNTSGTESTLMFIDGSNNRTTFIGNVYSTGFFQTSQRELKTNIETYDTDALALINKLKVNSFNFKSNTEEKHIGFIVDEVDGVNDEILNVGKTAINKDNLIAQLTKAVQQLSEELKGLKCQLGIV